MKTNTIEAHINAKRKSVNTDRTIKIRLTNYLRKTSVSHKGSSLNTLLSPKQVVIAREFINLMGKHKFAGSMKLGLFTKMSLMPLSKFDMNHDVFRNGITYRLSSRLIWRRLWSGSGYQIGVLAPKNTLFISYLNATPVYLCSDLSLRIRRNSPVFGIGSSLASGTGAIPIKELPNFSFQIGRFNSKVHNPDSSFKIEKLEDLLIKLAETNLIK